MTTTFFVSVDFHLDVPRDEAEGYLDAIASALADSAEVDGDVAVDLSTNLFEVCITLDAPSMGDALAVASAAAQAAVHAAGIGSGEWVPANDLIRRAVVEPIPA